MRKSIFCTIIITLRLEFQLKKKLKETLDHVKNSGKISHILHQVKNSGTGCEQLKNMFMYIYSIGPCMTIIREHLYI